MYYLGIEAFLAIIENGSVTKAADILHLSQSSVSHRLKTLEMELGFKLLERRAGIRGVALTDRGRAFINLAEKSILLEKDIERIRAITSKKPLTIGVADSISLYLLPNFYKHLMTVFEEVQPRIITQHTLETYEGIKAGEINIGFVKHAINMPNVTITKLLDEEMVLVRHGDERSYEMPIEPSLLDSRHEIFMDWGYNYQIWHDALWKENSHMICVDAAHLIFELLDHEKYWSIVPKSIYESMKHKGNFCIQTLRQNPPRRSCFLIKHKYMTKDMQPIVEAIKAYFLNNG